MRGVISADRSDRELDTSGPVTGATRRDMSTWHTDLRPLSEGLGAGTRLAMHSVPFVILIGLCKWLKAFCFFFVIEIARFFMTLPSYNK